MPTNKKVFLETIAEERLRQARQSFNVALAIIVISFVFSLTGAGLLLSNKVTEGTVTTGAGLLSSVQSLKFAKDKNEQLNKVWSEINKYEFSVSSQRRK